MGLIPSDKVRRMALWRPPGATEPRPGNFPGFRHILQARRVCALRGVVLRWAGCIGGRICEAPLAGALSRHR